ncbi:putative ASST-domain-containing protein [Seiridium unicorne]|uniref:ASST-domain-containing protein n=1 Tax=Seiridium unicorne TaxID=138068 RepID=A0ABR2UPJ8_9PEZI
MVSFSMARTRATAIALLSLSQIVNAIDSASFDSGTYGSDEETPYQTFTSSPQITPPELLIYSNTSSAITDGYVFIGVDGTSDSGQMGPCIYDMSPGDRMGTLVWTGMDYNKTFDVSLQTYKGEPVMTFFNGTLLDGFGHGSYYILNQSYSEIMHFSPVGYPNLGDLHEFRITDNDTALVTLYIVQQADLTTVNGTEDGYIYECAFQEIDIETGELIFMWNATDHVALNETYNDIGSAGDESTPFDWFHINSVTKDDDGNYLISSRTTWTLYKIDGSTGEIIWRLHGRNSDFEVTDADFHWQHNARWTDTAAQKYITIFDNQGDDDDTYSRGMLLAVDQDAMTVTLEQEFHNGDSTYSKYEGNLQCLNCSDLSSTNWFQGYGNQPYFTEFSADGTVVLDVQFAVDNAINSYRAYKYPLTSWVGQPTTNPNISWDTSANGVYFSWNGATEVETWEVYTADTANSSADWTKVASATRTGFETLVDVSDSDLSTYVRGKALDSSGSILGLSDATDGSNFYTLGDESTPTSSSSSTGASAAAESSATSTDDSDSAATTMAPGIMVGVSLMGMALGLVL